MSYSLTKIDRLILQSGQHYHLNGDDDCYFFGEYTARRGYSFGETNQLIYNLKKGMERFHLPDFKYKTDAIRTASTLLRQQLASTENLASLRAASLVPIPPSKAKDHPLYDDRLLTILNGLNQDGTLDIRELIVQTETIESFHGDNRLPPDILATKYRVVEAACQPIPNCIWLFDDVITTGAHFKAAKQVIRQRFPGMAVAGIFIARRVPESSDI